MKNSIGIFDSGLGGLTIYSAAKKLLPDYHFIYLADQKNCPYGDREDKEIRRLTEKGCKFLVAEKCRLIVIACNTATVSSISYLRKRFKSTKFIGVVPVVKPAVKVSKTGHFVILSTQATSNSEYLKLLIKKYAGEKRVYNLCCSGLAELIESGNTKSEKITLLLKKCLALAIKDKKVDVVATGCTHYPFVKEQIKLVFTGNVRVIDASLPVARQIKRVAEKIGIEKGGKKTRDLFFTTQEKKVFSKNASQLLGLKIHANRVKL